MFMFDTKDLDDLTHSNGSFCHGAARLTQPTAGSCDNSPPRKPQFGSHRPPHSRRRSTLRTILQSCPDSAGTLSDKFRNSVRQNRNGYPTSTEVCIYEPVFHAETVQEHWST